MRKGKIEQSLEQMTNAAIQSKSRGAMKWYIGRIQSVKGGAGLADQKIAAPVRQNHKPYVGGMFQYMYDAKWKEELPYWDAFPLVIPIELYSDGFLGLNLHYLPIRMRAKMLDILMGYEKTTKTGSNGRRVYMALSYGLLKGLSTIPAFQHCLKRYLFNHIKSKVIRIESDFWEDVAFLPTQQFQKQSEKVVWADARTAAKSGKRKKKGKK